MRHIKFIILEKLVKDYESGKYSDLVFLNLITNILVNKRD
jgi:hypothetical protein